EKLYQAYKDRGFAILDFPCNQFGNQAPGGEEVIHSFCTLKYNVSFPQFAKIEVNGANESPLYTFLKKEKGGVLGSAIKWNFTKFLVDRQGKVVERFAPTATPESIEDKVKALL
ncbi:MAG: glutathione peroxidase, partial [Oscillospiraceae bacterium]|nr:glutathione peroxidase [Oscillospiraceae bacterium]